MNLNLKDITFIVVTYKSDNIIQKCLNTLPSESQKVIVENSNNINLKKDLKAKYDNIEVILSQNIGMGSGNNLGIKSCKTKYAFILNPDTQFKPDTLDNLINSLTKVQDFTIASPLNDNPELPNYKKLSSNQDIDNNILSVDRVDGFSMLLNLNNFSDKNYFDENIFLYLENDDLCLRVKKKEQKIYLITNSLIYHKGSISNNIELEYLRNWHWMWSKFYFNKKHYGFINAFSKIFFNLLSAILKYLINLVIFNKHKKQIYKMRILGILNSVFGKKSFYRIDN